MQTAVDGRTHYGESIGAGQYHAQLVLGCASKGDAMSRFSAHVLRMFFLAAIVSLVAFWVALILEDDVVGFGIERAALPEAVLLALLTFHVVTAVLGSALAIITLFAVGRVLFAFLFAALLPLATVMSLVAAMTDAWAWHAAARDSVGSYLVAVAIVAAGPVVLLALLLVAYRGLRPGIAAT